MNKFKGLVAASAAALGLYSASAKADNDENEFRLEHRLQHPVTQGSEPNFFTLTGVGAVFAGINGVELNHQLVGYGAGGKINLHIGLDSFALSEENPEAMENRLYLGLELSDMFVANVTGGVYDGFVNNINAALSLSGLDPSLGWSAYVGTGVTIVDTIDPWLNHDTIPYGNVHAGGRMLFEKVGSLELEAGLITNGEDNGFYMVLGLGAALPDIY